MRLSPMKISHRVTRRPVIAAEAIVENHPIFG
jgi:hypothetical protein